MTYVVAAVVIGVWWVLPFWVCVTRGVERGRNGWAWGLLGWLGVLMIFLLPARTVEVEERPETRWDTFHRDVFGDR